MYCVEESLSHCTMNINLFGLMELFMQGLSTQTDEKYVIMVKNIFINKYS